MKSMYFLFAATVLGLFCLVEYRGMSMDSNQARPDPQFYSYHGRSSGGGGYFGSSSSRGYYSHK